MPSKAWEARNARAQALGFRNYYDYRVHNYGRSSERATGSALRVLRGHAGREDLLAWAKEGGSTVSRIVSRDEGGRRTVVEVQYADDRGIRTFKLRGGQVSSPELQWLHGELEDRNVDVDSYEAVWGPA